MPSAADAAFLYSKPRKVFGSTANSAAEIGTVGCGGREVSIGKAVLEDPNVRIGDDARPSQMDWLISELKLSSPRTQGGRRHGYRELVNAKLDAIFAESPTSFHHEQVAATSAGGQTQEAARREHPYGVSD